MKHAQQALQTDLAHALRLFFLDNEARNLSPRTCGYYVEKLTPFLTWLGDCGVKDVAQLDANHIRQFIVEQQERGLSPYTVHGFARCIRTFCFFLVREGMLDVSPFARVKMPVLPKDLLPSFTTSDVRALLRACNNERDTALILTLLDSGVRASELISLDVGDLDMTTGALTVHRGKGRKARVTFVGAKARLALAKYMATRSNTLPTAPLFVGLQAGMRLHYSGLRTMLRRLGARAGVADVDAHRFRRTFAIESLRAGMPIMQLAAMMGHGSLPVLQRYLQLLSSDLQQAHREHGPVDSLLAKGRGKS